MVNKVSHIVPQSSTVGFEANGRAFPSSIIVDDWRNGVGFVQASCNPAKGWFNVCDVPAVADKDFCSPSIVEFFPFPIFWGEECFGDDVVNDDLLARARQMLNASRSAVMAKEISDSIYSNSPSFADVAIPLNDAAVDLKTGISWLLDNRVRSGVGGKHKIHLPALLAPSAQELQIASNSLYDIVVDNYVKDYVPVNTMADATVPAVVGANEAWVTVTGEYEYSFTNPEYVVAESLDAKRGNGRVVRFEQQAIFRFDVCNVFAVKVRLVGC